MPYHDAHEEPAAEPAAAPPVAANSAAAAVRAARGGTATPSGVLALQRAVGNAAVGRLLARQPAVLPGKDDLIDPFERTPEELRERDAAVAQAKVDLRERALVPLEHGTGLGFLSGLRDLQPGQRGILLADPEFWARVRKRLSGLALWATQVAVQYGNRAPSEVYALNAALHEGNWSRTRLLIMAYPSLKKVEGLRAAVAHKFSGKLAEDLAAVIAEGGTRAEAGARDYQEAHYKAGVVTEYVGTRNYELVRLPNQLRVIVRIRLQNDASNTENAVTDKAIARWEEGIKRRWNGKFRLRGGGKTLDVWFLPVFVHHDLAAHHDVRVLPGDETSNEHKWYEEDSADTAAHEFGHMIGNPDEYNLPGSMAEIPAALGLSDAEKRRSSWEGLTGKPAAPKTAGYDMENLMGAHWKDASVRARHGWDVLEVFNEKLRLPGEDPWTIELKK